MANLLINRTKYRAVDIRFCPTKSVLPNNNQIAYVHDILDSVSTLTSLNYCHRLAHLAHTHEGLHLICRTCRKCSIELLIWLGGHWKVIRKGNDSVQFKGFQIFSCATIPNWELALSVHLNLSWKCNSFQQEMSAKLCVSQA